ncbi:hypothetical protein [Spirillospora sp. NPDC047279]|uniref:hypothetical protein n=1 Tax=Spirillospora sp. NPDC047279 TaxID=3155478 RepID=UPI0033DC63A2
MTAAWHSGGYETIMIEKALGAGRVAAWVLAGLFTAGTVALLLMFTLYVQPNGAARAWWAFAVAAAFIGVVHWLVALATSRFRPGALGLAMAVTAVVFCTASWSAFGGLMMYG